ncbi:sterol carrier protein domain-containing protein [uncultured Acetatifactor sp.]|uniref:sterol carrier protein domain-containing protein n=1 Tax=uncultured Acetatifactor sp. TaxID=1671927 RepID=UPI0026380A4C|nr:sterol carrier protein domain-containing protein [uncultured Acetatifactor sp.]
MPENNHTFLLDFAPGRENLVERTEGPADIELDAGNLAVLLGGCRGADSIAMTPDIRVNAPGIDLSQVFYRKPCHILDLF